eukprot:364620-Chlamydomonas_euryale.AAC.5
MQLWPTAGAPDARIACSTRVKPAASLTACANGWCGGVGHVTRRPPAGVCTFCVGTSIPTLSATQPRSPCRPNAAPGPWPTPKRTHASTHDLTHTLDQNLDHALTHTMTPTVTSHRDPHRDPHLELCPHVSRLPLPHLLGRTYP